MTGEDRARPGFDETLAAPPLDDEAASPGGSGPTLLAGRYEILGMLGGGAMGSVYRARDVSLDEIIALKVLRRELARDPGALARFRSEVKLARRVTHANVARTFDIGGERGELFLTMELVGGESLGARLAREGALPVLEIARIATEIVRGLEAAHQAGVVHRDLKPDNVMLSGSRVVISDFGVARALARGNASRTMGVTGTPAYMAPEQVEGRADVDGRADYYALGVMLFEMFSGELPFDGDSAVAVAAARLLRDAPSVSAVAPDVPDGAARLVSRLLARNPDERGCEPARVIADLAKLTAAPAPAEAPSRRRPPSRDAERSRTLAVLPFANRGTEDDAYLAEGLAEDLVDVLSVAQGLRVRPFGESRAQARVCPDAREAGREMGVEVVLSGALRRDGEIVRMSVRLVTVDDGFQLWAKRFALGPDDVGGAPDRIADEVVAALAAERGARTAAISAEAYDLYLRGRHVCDQGWVESHPEGVRLLTEAQSRALGDGKIAGRLSVELARASGVSSQRDGAAVTKALAMAENARQLDPSRPDGAVARAMVHWWWSEHVACVDALDEAFSLDRDSPDALLLLGRLLGEAGRAEEGMILLRRAERIAPDVAGVRAALVWQNGLLGEREEADRVLASMRGRPSDAVQRMLSAARQTLWRRDAEQARALLDEVARSELSPFAVLAVRGLLIVFRTELDASMLSQLELSLPVDIAAPARRAFFAHLRAEIFAAANMAAPALEAIAAASANGSLDVLWMDRCPLLEDLRGEAAFEQLAAQMRERARVMLERASPLVARLI